MDTNKNMDIQEENHNNHIALSQIRGSISVLIIKLLVSLFLFDLLYAGVFYLLNIEIKIPFVWHHHLSIGIFILLILKTLLQGFLITFLVLTWTNSLYIITKKHLILKKGIFRAKEDVYNFINIRHIAMNQSVLGKVFNYGDIELKLSSSGGLQEDVILMGIENPKKYEELLKQYF